MNPLILLASLNSLMTVWLESKQILNSNLIKVHNGFPKSRNPA